MPNDSLTLVLSGEVTLDKFPSAVARWGELIASLTGSLAQGAEIKWVIEDLRPGSALITVRGVSPEPQDEPRIEEISRAYLSVGKALEQHLSMPYPGQIAQNAYSLQRLIDGGIETIRFSNDEDDAIISRPETLLTPEMRQLATEGSYGVVEGRVETLGRRRGLQFTLYDSLHDRPVSCYVSAGNEEMMRDIWAKYAVVKGWIRRDPISGRPQTVRRIEAVDILPEKQKPREYQEARGVVNLGGEKPEDIVRRIRDAW